MKLWYVLLALAAAVVLWWVTTPARQPVGVLMPATPSRDVQGVATVLAHPKALRVYTKPAAIRLGLPAGTAVIAASTVKPDQRPQTVITTVNTETGETETLFRRDPYPLFKPEQHGEARIDYGYKGAQQVTRLSVREDLLQVKGLHFGVAASIDTDLDRFAGVGVGWRW